MKIDLNSISVLESIARNGSFAKAAEELNLVRSALTYTVKNIETKLNITIFDRSGHKAQLTPIGKYILEQGSDLLKQAQILEDNIQQIASGWETELHIVYDDIIPLKNLFPLIELFHLECPHIQLHITAERLKGTWEALFTKRADLIIGAAGDFAQAPEISTFTLGQLDFDFAVAPHHPLASLPEPIKNSEIIKYCSVVANDTAKELTPMTTGRLLGQDRIAVNSIHSKFIMQCAGLAVGFLPKIWIHDAVKKGKLIVKKVEKSKAGGNVSVAWNNQKIGKGLQWWLDHLRDKPSQLFTTN